MTKGSPESGGDWESPDQKRARLLEEQKALSLELLHFASSVLRDDYRKISKSQRELSRLTVEIEDLHRQERDLDRLIKKIEEVSEPTSEAARDRLKSKLAEIVSSKKEMHIRILELEKAREELVTENKVAWGDADGTHSVITLKLTRLSEIREELAELGSE